MVTNILHVYMSVTVQIGLWLQQLVTIMVSLIIDVCMCVCVCVCVCVYGACMRACVCEFYEESIFSVSFRARILTFYILAMTNPKMTIIQRLLATMS